MRLNSELPVKEDADMADENGRRRLQRTDAVHRPFVQPAPVPAARDVPMAVEGVDSRRRLQRTDAVHRPFFQPVPAAVAAARVDEQSMDLN